MTKAQLIAILAERLDITKGGAKDYLDEFQASILTALQKGEKVSLPGFLTFSMREVKALPKREGRNPATGETITLPPRKKGKKAAVTMSSAYKRQALEKATRR